MQSWLRGFAWVLQILVQENHKIFLHPKNERQLNSAFKGAVAHRFFDFKIA